MYQSEKDLIEKWERIANGRTVVCCQFCLPHRAQYMNAGCSCVVCGEPLNPQPDLDIILAERRKEAIRKMIPDQQFRLHQSGYSHF